MYIRSVFETLQTRLLEPRRLIQVITGPRQVGKTTGVRQILKGEQWPTQTLLSADEPSLRDRHWLHQQWTLARKKAATNFLVIDEIQKIPNWSETVKSLWDEDTANQTPLKVVLLGSTSMLIHKGLSESLAGRFELIRVTHWDYSEMKKSFGYSLEDWFFFGGYPGSAPLKDDLSRWKNYIRDSIIEPTIAQDILQMERVDKPALLRRLFELASTHSSKVLSFQKILGQLQDAGNATTLAHYLKLLDHAGMLSGLEKYSGSIVRKKASSPKLQVQDNALLSALEFEDPVTLSGSPEKWGKWVESGIGVHLLNAAPKNQVSVEYWLHRGFEVDFVLSKGARLAAFEVKSGRRKTKFSGLNEFKKHYPSAKTYVVGTDGIPLETFVTSSLLDWL